MYVYTEEHSNNIHFITLTNWVVSTSKHSVQRFSQNPTSNYKFMGSKHTNIMSSKTDDITAWI